MVDWPKQRMNMFQAKGLDWTKAVRPDDNAFLCFPGLLALGDREWDYLFCRGLAFPEQIEKALEVSQHISTETVEINFVINIVPEMRKHVARSCRFMFGVEGLHVQGA